MLANAGDKRKPPSALETIGALFAIAAFFEFVRDARASWAYASEGYFSFLILGALSLVIFVGSTIYRWVRWAQH